MRASVIGAGHVGLVTGACLAEKGHDVVCVDTERSKIDTINRGISPVYESELGELIAKNIHKKLRASTDLQSAVMESEITLIAVGTGIGEADLTAMKEVAGEIGRALARKAAYHVVVVKSTVVPGTTDEVVLPILEASSGRKAGVDFGVGMNPEFLSEGEAVRDFMDPGVIVLGGMDERSVAVLEELYRVLDRVEVLRTNNKTAEMIKYTFNALLATLISFSNEIGNLCATLGGIDVLDVMKGIHMQKCVSPILPGGDRIVPAITRYLQAGCGFGGSCLPKDTKALIAAGRNAVRPMRLLDAVVRVNEDQPRELLALLEKHFPSVSGVRIAILGLAFKPGTDDLRESPAIPVMRELLARGAQIKAYDPVVGPDGHDLFRSPNVTVCDDLGQTMRDVEAVVLVTGWKEFGQIPELLAGLDAPPVLVDGRRMLDKRRVPRYEGIGLGS